LNAVLGVLLALLARDRTGGGQLVDAAMVDGLAPWILYRWAFRGVEDPTYLSGEFPCYGVYEAADGRFLAVGALEAKFWERLCRHLGRPEWAPHQFDPGPARERIFGDLRAIFRTKPRDAWAEELAPADCCVTPVLELDELAGHPYWRHRGLTLPLADPSRAPLDLLGFPVKLSATPAGIRLPPPRLGEHTGEVLAGLGYGAEEVERIRASGAVG
jgi:crotonobetainyl-CoA:carnitine CoA-transferase CaiB-like acyl-CoA transferase